MLRILEASALDRHISLVHHRLTMFNFFGLEISQFLLTDSGFIFRDLVTMAGTGVPWMALDVARRFLGEVTHVNSEILEFFQMPVVFS